MSGDTGPVEGAERRKRTLREEGRKSTISASEIAGLLAKNHEGGISYPAEREKRGGGIERSAQIF